MLPPDDLILRDAILTDGRRVDIAVRAGRIARIAPANGAAGARESGVRLSRPSPADGAAEESLGGQLVLPSFVDLHTHLDKAFTLDLTENASGTLMEAILSYAELGPRLTHESFVDRALRTLRLCAAAGTTAVRTHVNVGMPESERVLGRSLLALEALLEVRERLGDLLEMQIVLLPEGNLARHLTLRAACEEALRLGADLVGGAPALDPDPEGAVDGAFELAMRFDRDVDLHVDESDDPRVCTLRRIATLAREHGYAGRVTAGHCCSLAAMDDDEAARIIDLVAAAHMTIVTLPSCNLYLQGRADRQPIRRGLTRVKELMAAGVNVAASSDNIRDPFNPFGRGDLLQIADLLAHAVQLGSPTEQASVRDAIGANPRGCFARVDAAPLRGGLLHEGDAADLVVCAARSAGELIAAQPTRTLVLRRGRVIARAHRSEEVAF